MKKAKSFFLYAIIFLLSSAAASAASFSGYAGLKGDFYSNDESKKFDPVLKSQSYFAGQLDVNPNFLARAEFSIQTEDIIDTGLFKETQSLFCIDELSFTYIKPFLGITQYLNAFIGTYEPIGSDVFLQRQFGISPITSLITESWLGLKGSTVYPFYGIGGSYIIHINDKPIATGVYIYKNDLSDVDSSYKDNDAHQLNIDFRFASVTTLFSVDFAAGIGAPLDTKNGSEDVILLIDKLYAHTGVDILIGNRYTQSLFLQAGFTNMPLVAGKGKNEISSNEIYLLLEPRLYTPNFRADLTFFSVPKDTCEKLIFINNPFGVNLSIYTDKLYIKNRDYTFGFHTSLSFPDRDFYDLKRIKQLIKDDYSIKVCPFVYIPVMTGSLKCMLQAEISGFKVSRWQDQFKLNIGYKSQL